MSYNPDVIKWNKTYGPKQSTSVGTQAPGVKAEHFTADGYNYVTKLTVNKAFPDIPGGADLRVGILAYTFPAGVHLVEYAGISIAFQQADGFVTADQPEVGLGTVIGTTAAATLSTTTEDILTGQVMNDCDGTPEVITLVVPDAGIVSLVGDVKAMFLNAADGWAANGEDALLATGTIWVKWTRMG